MIINRKSASTEMQLELERHQDELRKVWLDKSMPEDWNGMDSWERLDREKTRVTVRLDADMVRWFRKLGPGYGRRINAILRIYWMALLSGHIEAYDGDNVTPRLFLNAHAKVRELEEGR
ncbi:BrnA antitoxin family protein [Parasedimentitalea huanghaiensis]|nr:BrnA antitoxin family protein [Zongyanglinia huanghaiensis]